jgi:hypothetical protein
MKRRKTLMRKIGIIAVLSMLVVALAAVPALAANPHFIGTPQFTDEGTTLVGTGSVAGLGGENIDVQLDATGLATITCGNPGNNPDVPGQRTEFTVTGTQSDIEVKNGRAFFNVETAEPVANAADVCPSARWTATVTDVEFTSATITVFQPAGSDTEVLSQTFQL